MVAPNCFSQWFSDAKLVLLKERDRLLDGRLHRCAVIALDLYRFHVQSPSPRDDCCPLAHRLKMGLLTPVEQATRTFEACGIGQRRSHLQLPQVGDVDGHVSGCMFGVLAKENLVRHGGKGRGSAEMS